MAQLNHTSRLLETEEALSRCSFASSRRRLRSSQPPCPLLRESIKRLSDSEVIALALFQQLRGVQSERSFLRDAQRLFSHLFPGVVGLHPSSFHRRVSKLRPFLEPLRRDVLYEMVGNPETLLVDSPLLSVLHPRQISQGSGFSGAAWVRWGSFSVYGVKLHLICATKMGSLSLLRAHPCQHRRRLLERGASRRGGFGGWSSEEALGGAGLPQRGVEGGLGRGGHPSLVKEPSARRRGGLRQRVEIAICSLKRVFGLGETLASTLVGLATGSRPK